MIRKIRRHLFAIGISINAVLLAAICTYGASAYGPNLLTYFEPHPAMLPASLPFWLNLTLFATVLLNLPVFLLLDLVMVLPPLVDASPAARALTALVLSFALGVCWWALLAYLLRNRNHRSS